MAIIKMPQSNRIQVKVQMGISASGAPVYAIRSFYNVKASATETNMYAVAQGLAGLQKHTLTTIFTVATYALVEQ